MELVYKHLLADSREEMVGHIVSHGLIPRVTAEAMIDQLWDRLVHRLTEDHADLDQELAERIMNEALGFLWLSAISIEPYGPSELVDKGWHAFLLYTYEYAAFCAAMCGRFIHHVPDDVVSLNRKGITLDKTVLALHARGPVDWELWPAEARKCSKCSRCGPGENMKTTMAGCNGGKCDNAGGCEGRMDVVHSRCTSGDCDKSLALPAVV